MQTADAKFPKTQEKYLLMPGQAIFLGSHSYIYYLTLFTLKQFCLCDFVQSSKPFSAALLDPGCWGCSISRNTQASLSPASSYFL